jgi:hypothetical protein
MDFLLSSPHVKRWVNRRMLLLVLWDAVDHRPATPYWDQRLVYNHAVLSYTRTGRLTYLAMVDMDEYVGIWGTWTTMWVYTSE